MDLDQTLDFKDAEDQTFVLCKICVNQIVNCSNYSIKYICLLYIRLQENHADEVKQIKAQVEDLRCLLAQSQKESQSLKSELQAQKEANSRAPTTTMRNLVERLKSQLALKEKQQKVSNNRKLSIFKKNMW